MSESQSSHHDHKQTKAKPNETLSGVIYGTAKLQVVPPDQLETRLAQGYLLPLEDPTVLELLLAALKERRKGTTKRVKKKRKGRSVALKTNETRNANSHRKPSTQDATSHPTPPDTLPPTPTYTLHTWGYAASRRTSRRRDDPSTSESSSPPRLPDPPPRRDLFLRQR